MNTEQWKDIEGYEGIYMISNLGKVISLARTIKGPGNIGTTNKDNKFLKTRINFHGYVIVGLSRNGVTKTHYVHRLVAKSFISNPNFKKQVNHLNGDKTDNRIENLEWATPSENLKHCLKNNLRVMPSGINHWRAKE